MIYGERLTEHSDYELQVLLNAVATEIAHINGFAPDADRYIAALDQWRVKIIEAKTEIRLREIQTEN